MAIEVYQHFDGPDITVAESTASKLFYRVIGTSDDQAALAAALAAVPATYADAPRKSLRLERGGVDGWLVEVDYSGVNSDNDDEWSFDTTGATAKITQSLETVARYAPSGETAEDYKGAIGVTDSGIDGCDIVIGTFKFSRVRTYAGDVLADGYASILKALTGKVNNAPFCGQAVGEVLFAGAKGSKKGSSPWKLSYDFIGSENQTGIVVGPITGISKSGHQYLWVRYEETDDAAAHRHVKRPRSAYVERVYRSANFALLGLGV